MIEANFLFKIDIYSCIAFIIFSFLMMILLIIKSIINNAKIQKISNYTFMVVFVLDVISYCIFILSIVSSGVIWIINLFK